MKGRWLLLAFAAVGGAVVVAAGACGDEDGVAGSSPTSASGGQAGSGGAAGEAPGIPLFGESRVLSGGQPHPTRLALDGTHVYWTTRGGTAGAGAAPVGGSGGAGGGGGGAGAGGAGGSGGGAGAGGGSSIVISGAVVRVGRTGGTPTTLTLVPSVTALTVDDGYVFFAVVDEGVGSIRVVPAEGGEALVLLTGLGWPADVAVDADHIYWSEVGADGGVWAAPRPEFTFVDGGVPDGGAPDAGGPDGGGFEQLHAGSDLLTFLRLDSQTLYFSDHGVAANVGAIGAVNLQTEEVELIAEELDRPRYFTVLDDWLYVVTEGDGRVHRFAANGSGTTTVLAYGQDRPYGVTVDEQAIYWTNSSSTPPAGDCESATGSVVGMPRGGGPITELANNQACPLAIAVDDTGLYWINFGLDNDPNSGAIMRMPKR